MFSGLSSIKPATCLAGRGQSLEAQYLLQMKEIDIYPTDPFISSKKDKKTLGQFGSGKARGYSDQVINSLVPPLDNILLDSEVKIPKQ